MPQYSTQRAGDGDRPGAVRSAGVGFILLATLLFCAVFIQRSGADYEGARFFTLFDDAMISMTYARNLAEGHGLVWNPGGEAVEGYTNFLWTLWMALLHLLPVAESKISLLVMGTGVVLLLANALAVASLAQRLAFRSSAAFLFAVGGSALCFPLLFWTLRGMEVGLLALLLSLAFAQALRLAEGATGRSAWGLGALLGAGLLVRPDFAVAAGAIGAFVAVAAPSEKRRRVLWPIAVVASAIFALHTAFRLGYYGDALPNTYYLKMTGYTLAVRVGRGLSVFADGVVGHLWPLLLLGTVAAADRAARALPAFRLFAGVAGLQCAYSIWVGGDAWEEFDFANRFIAVVLPALVLCAAKGIDVVSARVVEAAGGRAGAGLAVALLGIALVWIPVNAPHFRRWRESGALVVDKDHRLAQRGLRIRAETPEDTRIGVMAAGAVPYFARRYSIDLLGKCDPVIAHAPPVDAGTFHPGHAKWDYRYSVGELKPDLIVQLALLFRDDRAYFRTLDYVRAPRSLGSYMTPELGRRLVRAKKSD